MRLKLFAMVLGLTANCTAPEKAYPAASSPASALDQAVTRAANDAKAGAILDVQGCGLAFREARGVADRKTRAPMPLDEPLRIASVSKLYTAAVIHRLSAQGRIDLDKPATDYITTGELDGVPNAGATLRQMLNHTSGVPDYYDVQSVVSFDWSQTMTPERAYEVARRRAAAHPPGAAYAYSNTNYHILSRAAESATGQGFAALVDAEVLAPLALTATRYNTAHPGGAIHGYGLPYRPNTDTWNLADNTGADAGITATSAQVGDYLRALFFADGAFATTGAAMLDDRVPRDKARQFAGAGAEILVSRTGTELVGHTGDTFGYLTFAFAIPAEGVTMVGHINADRPEALNAMLKSTAEAVAQACAEPSQPGPVTH